MDMRKFRVLVLPAAMLAGCAAPGASVPTLPVPERYGLDPEQPVEVCRPEGERRYLARLICPSGEHPASERTGNGSQLGRASCRERVVQSVSDSVVAGS